MYLAVIEFMNRLAFGEKFYFIFEWLLKNPSIVGMVGFAYGCVLFYGSVCAKKWIPRDFQNFVFNESAKILKNDSSIEVEDLASQIYEKWIDEVPNLPSKYRIPTRVGLWIERPTVQSLEENYRINEIVIIDMFKRNMNAKKK